MPARRTPIITGRPAISTPREGDADALARGFDNTRERIEFLEREVLFLGQLLEGSTGVQDILAIRTQIAKIIAQLNVLSVRVAATAEPDDNDGQQASVLAEVVEMKKVLLELNTAPPTGLEAALAELTKRVDGLEQGVLA